MAIYEPRFDTYLKGRTLVVSASPFQPFKMATYMSFPVGIFYYFNQPSFFEGWMMKERHKLFPPEDPKVNILLKRQKDAMETKREAQWIK